MVFKHTIVLPHFKDEVWSIWWPCPIKCTNSHLISAFNFHRFCMAKYCIPTEASLWSHAQSKVQTFEGSLVQFAGQVVWAFHSTMIQSCSVYTHQNLPNILFIVINMQSTAFAMQHTQVWGFLWCWGWRWIPIAHKQTLARQCLGLCLLGVEGCGISLRWSCRTCLKWKWSVQVVSYPRHTLTLTHTHPQVTLTQSHSPSHSNHTHTLTLTLTLPSQSHSH